MDKSAAWKPLHHSDIISEEWLLGYFTHSSQIMSELGKDEKPQERENNSNENKCYWLAKNIPKGLPLHFNTDLTPKASEEPKCNWGWHFLWMSENSLSPISKSLDIFNGCVGNQIFITHLQCTFLFNSFVIYCGSRRKPRVCLIWVSSFFWKAANCK